MTNHRVHVSRRAARMPSSPIRKLYLFSDSLRQRGISVLHLNIGQPDIATPRAFFNTLKNFKQDILAYAPSSGFSEVIGAWQKYYRSSGIDFSTKDIMVTTGGSEAIVFALTTVTDPGDEVIVFEPLYPNYISFATMAGIRLRPIPLSIENKFHLPDARIIARHVSRRTKAILLCNPSNPTGTVFSKEELMSVARLARRYNLFIIADEAYREFIFDGKKHVSMASLPQIRDRLILVDSASKRFNVYGARIGCIASRNKEVMDIVFKYAQGRLAAPTIDQLAVAPLLLKSKMITKGLVREYQARRDMMLSELSKMPGVSYTTPEGAFYSIVELPVHDAEHFCRWMVEYFHYHHETVMLAPAEGFYVNKRLGKRQVRIAYVLNRQKLQRAMVILRKGLDAYYHYFK